MLIQVTQHTMPSLHWELAKLCSQVRFPGSWFDVHLTMSFFLRFKSWACHHVSVIFLIGLVHQVPIKSSSISMSCTSKFSKMITTICCASFHSLCNACWSGTPCPQFVRFNQAITFSAFGTQQEGPQTMSQTILGLGPGLPRWFGAVAHCNHVRSSPSISVHMMLWPGADQI